MSKRLPKVLVFVTAPVCEDATETRWRKLKGVAKVRLLNGTIRLAELHWYEAHGIGKKEFKVKLPFLD